jgi:TetR/AcrR family transcriptional regulator, transcriptional repressor for nem operon
VARPRRFSTEEVVEAARIVFWARGYGGTAISDLEQSTRLNRSSLYHAFGSKEALFHAALRSYIDDVIGPLISPMEAPSPDAGAVEGFFRSLAGLFHAVGAPASRGCLWLNSIAEFAGREAPVEVWATASEERHHRAFANALTGAPGGGGLDPVTVEQRARLLTVATYGLWLVVRVDPVDAALACEAVISQVRSWSPP